MVIGTAALPAAGSAATPELDRRVQAFLDAKRPEWSRGINYWNIRYEDGRRLHEIVVARGFKRLLEVGTSTGHSAIWLAWAAAKTGGRLVTIEIDRERHAEALRNFRAAGVDTFIDARLADAHALVRELPGPWELVFQDADKEWYAQYWRDLKDKMASGGCYVADNVLRPAAPQVSEFVRAARADIAFDTRVEDLGSGEGLLLACRR
jgi:caffeoyl-CoA O-methyltransferase